MILWFHTLSHVVQLSGATGKTGRVIHPPKVPISIPCLWKGAHIMNFRASQLSDFQLYFKWIPPRSYLQCTYTCWHSLHMRKESSATEMTKLLRPHESHGVVQHWGFVSHSSVLAGGEIDICRWAAGKVWSCPWSHLALTTGIGMSSTRSVQ